MAVLEPLSPSATGRAPHRNRLAVLAALVAVALLCATGCAAEVHTRTAPATVSYREVTVYEEPVVHVATAPAYIETYPRVYYRGTYVYYVNGRWYYPTRTGWVYYRTEPRALVRYRIEFDRHRAHHHHHHHVHHHHAPRGHVHVHQHHTPRGHVHVHQHHTPRGHVHHAPAARPARPTATVRAGATVKAGVAARPVKPARPTATVRAGATVKADAKVRAGAEARPAPQAKPAKKHREEHHDRRRYHIEARRHDR